MVCLKMNTAMSNLPSSLLARNVGFWHSVCLDLPQVAIEAIQPILWFAVGDDNHYTVLVVQDAVTLIHHTLDPVGGVCAAEHCI